MLYPSPVLSLIAPTHLFDGVNLEGVYFMKLKNQVVLRNLNGLNKSCQLLPKHYEIIKLCMSLINQLEDFKFNKVILYGSCARGDARFGSDVDLCIVTNHKSSLAEVLNFKTYIYKNLPDCAEVDIKFIDEVEYSTSNTLFINDIRKDGVILCQTIQQKTTQLTFCQN